MRGRPVPRVELSRHSLSQKGLEMIKVDVSKRRKQKGTLGNKPGNQFCLPLNFLSLVRETTASSKTDYEEPQDIVVTPVILGSPRVFLVPFPYPSPRSVHN